MYTKLMPAKFPARLARGQSLVEFALAATLMMFLLVATVDFGIAFFSWITLRDAAQEGAIYGSMHPPLDAGDTDVYAAIRSRVKTAATTPVNLADLPDDNITIAVVDNGGNPDGNPCPGNGIKVTVTYDYPIITPMISNFVGSPTIPVSATVTDTILRTANGYTADCP